VSVGDATAVKDQPTRDRGDSGHSHAAQSRSVEAWKDVHKLTDKHIATSGSVPDLHIVGHGGTHPADHAGHGAKHAADHAGHDGKHPTDHAGSNSSEQANKGNEHLYNLKLSADNTVTLAGDSSNQGTGKLNPDGTSQKPEGQSIPGEKPTMSLTVADDHGAKGADALLDPALSQPEKLRAAQEMAHNGQKHFQGADGHTYDISTQRHGDREVVDVMKEDGQGHSHPVLRGVIDKNGNVTNQRDRHGKVVDFNGRWMQKHEADNRIVRHDDPPYQRGQDASGGRHDEHGMHEHGMGSREGPANRDQDQLSKNEIENAKDKIPIKGSPEDLQRLNDARASLQKNVDQNIDSPQDRERFARDMRSFENRAGKQPLSANEVANTYDQMSRLMEAKDGAVPKEDRVLAAETFAHHLADPTNIDQGHHGTCNVTALEEHLVTRNPSKAAEILSTTALTGQWVAPDGKTIKLDQGSMVPGVEERTNRPQDGQRSYATQLMNLALVNDTTQRRPDPLFYSMDKPSAGGDTGERLKSADGRDQTKDDLLHNGDKTAWNSSFVRASDISLSAGRLTGEHDVVISNKDAEKSPELVSVDSAQNLAQTLKEQKAKGSWPAIVLVSAADPMFKDAVGANVGSDSWHVLSVTDFDEKTNQVKISNQWGKANDITTDVGSLYRATLPPEKPKNSGG
jgi:hypothetical protein